MPKNLLYAYTGGASSKKHRSDNVGVLYAFRLGGLAVENDAVPRGLSGDFVVSTCKPNGHAGFKGLDTTPSLSLGARR